jgi:Uma2 family endonuclease
MHTTLTLSAPPPPRVAYDDFAMSAGFETHELVHGVPQERHVGFKSDLIATRVVVILDRFCCSSGIAFAVREANCRYDPNDPDHYRRPDGLVVLADRFPGGIPDGDLRIAPDLVIEVLSPGDVAVQVEAKIQEYLRFGVRLVWIVVPETRTVRIHRADGTVSLLHERDTISGESVLEGFACLVADFFPPGT